MRINTNLVCEEMGNDVVVLDSESHSVLTISGGGASVIKRLLDGEPLGEDEPGVAELVAQGILVTEEPNAVSRRTLMVSGAAIGAGGIVALSLPGVAMASSAVDALPAPLFNEGITGGDRAQFDGDSAFIFVAAISNFDETLVYEFRLQGGTDFFELDNGETGGDPILEKSYDGTFVERDLQAVDGQAFLRAKSPDGRVSAESPFTFADEDD